MTGRFTAIGSARVDAAIGEAVSAIGTAIGALRIPHLEGVVLGGGYGRGEGGVTTGPDGAERPYNDLDFYVIADDSSSAADLAEIGVRLAPVSRDWSARLGIDVDFSPAKTYWRIKHDEARVMVQELVRGYIDIAGKKGEELFAAIERRPAEALPAGEAVRLLMNRGAGLLLAKHLGLQAEAQNQGGAEAQNEGGADESALQRTEAEHGGFVARNLNKCVLGAGDARLIAQGRYAWRLEERKERLGDPRYSAATEWKIRPTAEAPFTFEEARKAWLDAEKEVSDAFRANGEGARTLRHAARWIVRRHTAGPLATFALDPSFRVMREIGDAIGADAPMTPAMRKDWEVFG